MPDPFAQLITEARAFLGELAENNSRDWFAVHKARYEGTLKAPALLLLDQVAHDLGPQTANGLGVKLFRPYRDVRFSKDKTPYHTHLHMMWSLGAKGRGPVMFLGIAPGYVRLGGGVMGFDKAALTNWRAAVDGAAGDALAGMLDDLAAKGLTPGEPALKRVPAPYDKAHRHAHLLRRKGLGVWRDLPAARFTEPQAAISEVFGDLHPLLQWIEREL